MGPGDVVGDRYELERAAGQGAMGVVFRARDRKTGELVAVKTLRGASEHVARFEREAKVLREVTHPAIVRYVDHGVTGAGERYLVMEWLEGETLADRLATRGLTLGESVELGSRVAEGLGALHRRGVVHRDLKPSNLFLRDGKIEGVKLVDFGIARLEDQAGQLTVTGSTLGTPGFMAPEQARGEPNVGPRADLFSLGSLLFRCLCGTPAFDGEDAVAVLLKVVLEQPPRVRDIDPRIPEALDHLVARLLEKSPDDRPEDAGEVAASLAALAVPSGGDRVQMSPLAPGLTLTERRMMCAILAHLGDHVDAELVALAAANGGKLQPIADGLWLVGMAASGPATDNAARAARCALRIRAAHPAAPLVIVAGQGTVAARAPVGEVIDRAVKLIGHDHSPPAARPSEAAPVWLDGVIGALLDARFDVGTEGDWLTLRGERDEVEPSRRLLGKVTRLIGRERELGLLEEMFDECASEPRACVALITGPAGIGKSRLRHELLARVRGRADKAIWLGRGDPMAAGAAFGLLGPVLRRVVGVRDDADPRARIEAWTAARTPPAHARRVASFLGELMGRPFPEEDHLELRLARRDAMLMGDQMRRAFEEVLAGECADHPVLLVLEDLHWGDLPSLRLLDGALRNLADRPLMVVGLARPEVEEKFPRLWADRGVHLMRLDVLSRRGSEALVREALGAVSPETLARLCERAAGNAFYLEELVRAVAEGRGESLPETVLGMVEARLERQGTQARRVLRAASVFGSSFSRSALAALLGRDIADLDAWIQDLVAAELIVPRPGAMNQPGRGFAFQHALVREAAYAMLTEEDRALGHRLAAEWLAEVGEAPALLAEHFERAGEHEQARPHCLRAATLALEGNDLPAVLAHVARGVACGATGHELGELRRIEAEARRWRGDLAGAQAAATEAMRLLASGSELWLQAAGEASITAVRLGHHDLVVAVVAELRSAGLSSDGRGAAHVARAAVQLFYAGQLAISDRLLAEVEQMVGAGGEIDPIALGWIEEGRATAAMRAGDLVACIRHMEASALSFERAGDQRNAGVQAANVGFGYGELGAYADAERILRGAMEAGQRLDAGYLVLGATTNLGHMLAKLGRVDDGKHLLQWTLGEALSAQHHRSAGAVYCYLAIVSAIGGDHAASEREARAALALEGNTAPQRAWALAILARALLATSRAPEALSSAREALRLVGDLGEVEVGEAIVRLAFAEALAASGEEAAAREAATVARDRLLARAANIGDARLRASFLGAVPEHARTFELCKELGLFTPS